MFFVPYFVLLCEYRLFKIISMVVVTVATSKQPLAYIESQTSYSKLTSDQGTKCLGVIKFKVKKLLPEL